MSRTPRTRGSGPSWSATEVSSFDGTESAYPRATNFSHGALRYPRRCPNQVDPSQQRAYLTEERGWSCGGDLAARAGTPNNGTTL